MIDGLLHPEVDKLAKLGASGNQPSHCSRDLVRSLGPAFKELPPISVVEIPVVGHRDAEPFQLQLEVQFPHDVFAHYAQNSQQFSQVFGSDEEICAFWDQKDLHDPAFRFHPAIEKEGFQTHCIPIKVHSDGVVMSKTESLHVASWSSFFAQGNILEVQLLYAAIVKSACIKDDRGRDTYADLYRALKWSLAACLDGRHPRVDWNEEPWAAGSKRARLANQLLHPEGKFLGVFSVLGDLDELCNQYGLAHFNSNQPCFWCGANNHDVPWTDLSLRAAWRATQLQPARVQPAPSPHQLWMVPGLTVFSVGWDILHGLDLGPTLHVIGNCLDDLAQLAAVGRNVDERMQTLWQASQHYYRELGITSRLPSLDLANFRRPQDFPRFKSKANEARHYLPVLEQLLQVRQRRISIQCCEVESSEESLGILPHC